MIVKTKIFKEGMTIQNTKAEKDDSNHFLLEFQKLPCLGDLVLIRDGDAIGEYVVEHPIVHEIEKNESCFLMILTSKPLPEDIRIAIND